MHMWDVHTGIKFVKINQVKFAFALSLTTSDGGGANTDLSVTKFSSN